ncbi:hypothetical protein [Bacillus sp. NPDC094106]|uniref:hypothetical protein n=1 Tax=Bacillus sp. NPDC094106 TaxID=3363949 RepID=UPI00380ADDAA
MAKYEVVVELQVKGLRKENDAYGLVSSMNNCEFCNKNDAFDGFLRNFSYDKKEKIGTCLVEFTINSKEGGVDSVLEEMTNCEYCHSNHEITFVKNSVKEIPYSCIDEISEAYRKDFYQPLQEHPGYKTISKDHVFDENQSVKWNREEVERQNELLKQRKEEWKEEKSRLNAKMQKDCIRVLKEDYNLNDAQADKLYWYIYQREHSCMHDFFIYLDEFAEAVKEIIELS